MNQGFDLYILNYNNYYNRIVKYENDLQSYLAFKATEPILGCAFKFRDGISTSIICNTSQDTGDYAVLTKANSNEIVARWFIVERGYNRNGQFEISLYRDTVADYIDVTVSSPAFIEKATLNEGDPLIFNSENMSFNKIKTAEYNLTDETGSAYIVGYIPRNFAATESKTIESSYPVVGNYNYIVNTLSDLSFYNLINQTFTDISGYSYNYIVKGTEGSSAYDFNVTIDYNSNISSNYQITNSIYSGITINFNPHDRFNVTQLFSRARDQIFNYNITNKNLYDVEANRIYETPISTLLNIVTKDGKIVYENSTGKYYKLTIQKTYFESEYQTVSSSQAALFNMMKNNLDFSSASIGSYNNNPNNNNFKIKYKGYRYILTYEEFYKSVKTTINNDRYHLHDNPWDMFVIPYSNIPIYKDGVKLFDNNPEAAMAIAQEWSKDLGVNTQFDIQLLPFNPVRTSIDAEGKIDVGSMYVHYINDGAATNPQNLSVIMWASQSSFSFEITNVRVGATTKIPVSTIGAITNIKIQNETEIFRLCSPNYNGQFEFSAAKNRGFSSFNVDCTYLPYNPYIHINPNFGGLYGRDFNDARGLICGGEFSLPQVSDAWTNYQLNNKNYLNSFERQIQNMEVSHKFAMTEGIANAITGTAGAAATGFASGGTAGAIVAGLTSASAGAIDLAIQQAKYNEAIDYTKDQFGYSLENIQALPNSIARTTAFTANNKIFPILEFYTCTDEEKQALIDKLKYNGMTVMRIGTMNQYIKNDEKTYIKAKLIRIEGLDNDTHLANTIASEIYKGVFI